jgi:regulatory protein
LFSPNGSPARDLSGRVREETRIIGEGHRGVKQGFQDNARNTVAPTACTPAALTACIAPRPAGIVAFMPDEPDSTPPDAGSLYQAALHYLARYAATEAGLRRVLDRRIDKWARAATDRDAVGEQVTASRLAARAVVKRLAESGAVNDAVFAESRARSLIAAGRSRRAVAAGLAAKGVAADLARSVLPDDAETELAAALVLARKRRIGPYRTSARADRLKEFGILARAGFPRGVAERALDTDAEDAEEAILRLRQG